MKRRAFLQLGMVTLPLISAVGNQRAQGQTRESEPFDLILKGGRVLDPSQSLDAANDVAVSDGKVAVIAPDLNSAEAKQTVDVRGYLVTPGLIDLHVHGFQGVSHAGIPLDPYCIGRGVTTAVDAGTSGADSFSGFRRYVIDTSSTRVLAFLNISRVGLISPVGELIDRRMIDRSVALRIAQEHADVIVGIKVRCSHFVTGTNDLEAVQLARSVGDAIGKPLMIHVGFPHSPIEKILQLARPGDIVTHAFRGPGEGGVIGPDRRVSDYVRAAAKRGVLFDVGHGSGSFSFEAAEAALQEGFLPSSISSDIHTSSILGPAFDLLTTLSKFLLLGMSLEKVIELSTLGPARAILRAETFGSLQPGRPADITVLAQVHGKFNLVDSKKKQRVATQKLVPILALREGKAFSRFNTR